MKTIACVLCGSTHCHPVAVIPDLWMEQLDRVGQYVVCESCGLVYQNPQPEEEDLASYYPEKYRREQRKSGLLKGYGLKKRLAVLQRYKAGGSLLDLGCGDGSFIRAALRQPGWQAIGVEASEVEGFSQPGLDIRYGELKTLGFEAETFDAVTLWDVLEHLPDPLETLSEVKRILKPDGVLLMRLPNLESRDAQRYGKYWAGYDSPRHLFVFSPASLTRLLGSSEFTALELSSEIGGYLNTVKSIQFWLVGHAVFRPLRRLAIWLLRSLPARLIAAPFTRSREGGTRGSEMVVVALPKSTSEG